MQLISRKTMWRYIVKSYLSNVLFLTLVLLGLVLFFDIIELLRRAGNAGGVPFLRVLQMGFLKVLGIGQTISPFIILFSALLTFWQLNKRNEIVIFRSAGLSVWQFTGPVISVAFAIGIFVTTLINPVSSVLEQKFQLLEQKYLEKNETQIAVFENGLWLRQLIDGGYIIMHAKKLTLPDWGLNNVLALAFTADNQYMWRIDAPKARLNKGSWTLLDANLSKAAEPQQSGLKIDIPTTLTSQKIEDSFASPETMSFWKLPAHIKTIKSTGFNPSFLQVHFQSLIALPFLYASLILIAASVTLRPPRSQSVFKMIILGIGAGFTVFFVSSFLKALGASDQIPIVLAAWSPSLITTLMGVGVILSLEDG